MDLSVIKQKLSASQNKGQKREKVDYSKIFFKPKPGKYQVRILPSKFDKSNPFREVYFHYGFSKGPILALTNWGEKDPIVEFAKNLRKSSDKEDWQLAKKLDPKMRIVVPVIVRGEEHLGVRLWEFGKENYQALLNIADDVDYGDYTDIEAGRDFTVEGVSETVMGRTYVKTTLIPKPKTSQLSTDPALVEKWLDEQPDIMSLYKKFEFDELKDILIKFLEPETEKEDHVVAETATVEPENDGLPFTVEDNAPTKTSSADKFDDLFNEDK
jgi:hypothetical protein